MEAAGDSKLTGTIVSRYAIGDLIGAGGMGQVYLAKDERLQRTVAVKVLTRRDRSHRRERELVAEARALSRLSHPNVASVYDFVSESGRDFMVMEYVLGSTLKDLIHGRALPFAEVVRLGRQMIQGLAALHAAHVVHRDIKPANLKVSDSGQLKILDFGLAQPLPCDRTGDISTRTTPEFGPAGTMPYMSPEQLCGDVVDERSDVFSAGAVLYEMATGRPAFPQSKMAYLVDAILNHDPVAPSIVNPHLPVAFDRLVMKAMAKRSVQRYQTANEVDAALECLSEASDWRPATTPRVWLSGLRRWMTRTGRYLESRRVRA